ncbi:hypothetical protein [Sphingomonas sp. C3-2]|uniref:tetratricopeptide repeat protein n=1 Tax=Sphingomonas sp. C3-2 TaxID=3062169 RepID=UPI00294B03BA|nr:hypothetical protein [Sphingomonas sp. C3-2]WOK38134.1 hypothetical protein QYC26_08165 [Sphingomonas sp. C3-2]
MGIYTDTADVTPEGAGHDRVLQELESIFASSEFERAPVMRRLLGFLVRTTLAGRGDELKAYSVAVDGLGRAPDFDAQSDSYPRVQVGRLRKMLESYYLHHAPQDDIRFTIRPGSYRVHFVSAAGPAFSELPPTPLEGEQASPPIAPTPDASIDEENAPSPQTTESRRARMPFLFVLGTLTLALILCAAALWHWGWIGEQQANSTPLIEIEPIRIAGSRDAAVLAKRTEAFLGVALQRSWIVRIVDHRVDEQGLSEPDYRLIGQVNAGPGYAGRRLFLTLWDARTGAQIWSDIISLPDDDSTITTALRRPIADLIGPFGVIASDQRVKLGGRTDTAYGCLLDYGRYVRERDPQYREPVRACVKASLDREPDNATLLAAASFLEFDYSISGGTPAAHARGAEFARRAVAADPQSAQALLADARAAMVAGQCVRGREIAHRVAELNPYSGDNLGLLGFLLYQCGNDEEAQAMLRTARTLDNELPTFYFVAEVLALAEKGQSDAAAELAQSIRQPGRGMAAQYDVVRTIASAAKGDIKEARIYWAALMRKSAMPAGREDTALRPYFFGQGLRTRIIAYLQKTGVITTPA